MLAPGNYVQWKSRIKRYIDTKPNHELIHHCLKNPPYKFTWADKEVLISEGSLVTRTESYIETYKTVSQDICDQLNAEAEAVQIILTGIDNDIYSTVDACPNACEIWKAIERLKHDESINVQDLETYLYWEFGKFDILKQHQNEVNEIRAERIARTTNPLALVAQQQPVYHPQNHPTHYTQNSSTRSQQAATRNRRKAIVNSPQPIYDQEPSMVVKDDETSKDKEIDKLMALISLSFKKIYKPTNNNLRTSSNTSRANQDNSPRTNRSTRYENQKIGNVAGAKETVGLTVELEVHYMYMAQLQEVSPDAIDSGPIFDTEPLQKNDDDDADLVNERELLASLIEKLKCEIDESNNRNKFLEISNKVLVEKLKGEIEDFKNKNKNKNKNKSLESSNNRFKEANNKLSETNKLRYDDFKKSEAELTRRNSVDEHIDQNDEDADLTKERELLASLITKLKCEIDESKNRNTFLEASNKVLVEKLKSEIEDFKNKNKSLTEANNKLSKENDLLCADFKKSKAELKRRDSIEYATEIEQIDHNDEDANLAKERELLASLIEKLKCEIDESKNQLKRRDSIGYASEMELECEKVRGVIPTTSVSGPQIKSNQMEDRVLLNSSRGKKQEVEDQRRSVKFSKNKTSVTACNDSLKAKTLNVNFVCATCGKCMLKEKHDMCVLKSVNGVHSRTKIPIAMPVSTRAPKCTVKQSIDKPLKKTVASESNQKTRNITRKLYERVSKACSWWYPKFTPLGYKWKPKSEKENVNPNVSMHLGSVSRTSNILEPMTSRRSNVSNTPLSSNSFTARRDCPIHRRLWVLKAHDGAVTIKRVYYVEGLNHNLFSVGQFCDADLEVA
nr:integrase, catalytic region, zinc finger, CCHC-type, peptidase aspartic, catalytic [Tanacetum cinerariifolium]